MIFSVFQNFGFRGILGPPYCGISATIQIGQEVLRLPYVGFFGGFPKRGSRQSASFHSLVTGKFCIMNQTKCWSKSNKIQRVESCSKRSFQVFPKKKHVFEKRRFLTSFNGLYHFSRNLNQKRPYYKKDSLAYYLSCATLMTYVPVLGAEQFQFPCMVIFDSFFSNWFLLSLQTAKPSDKKRYCRFHYQDYWYEYFSVKK